MNKYRFNILDIIFALVAGYITAHPSEILPDWLIKLYDYPASRILILALLFAGSYYKPIWFTILLIGYAFISIDIFKSEKQALDDSEGFKDNISNKLNIQIAKALNPVDLAIEKVKEAEKLLKTQSNRR